MLALAALLLGGGAPVASAPLRIVGYNDMTEMLQALTARYTRSHPGMRFELVLKGTRTGPAALTNGSAALAPMGAAMGAADRAAFRAAHDSDPVEVHVAHDSLAPAALSSPTGVIVQRDAPLRAISLAQMRQLFTADAPNAITWRDLGARTVGGDRVVHPIGLAQSTAIGQFVLARLGAAHFAADFTGLSQSREVAAAVAADPDAIGLANLNNGDARLRALDLFRADGRRTRPQTHDIVAGRYPLDRQLLIYARRDGTGRIEPAPRAFLRFVLSGEGQRIIARGSKGYLPLNTAELRAERMKL